MSFNLLHQFPTPPGLVALSMPSTGYLCAKVRQERGQGRICWSLSLLLPLQLSHLHLLGIAMVEK